MKTSRAQTGMCLLLLLLMMSPGLDSKDDINEVPQKFQKLEYIRSVISRHDSRQENLRFGSETLQRWTAATNRRDQNAIVQVVSSSANRNNDIDFTETPPLDAYDHQIIIQLEQDDTIRTSADFLYNEEIIGVRLNSLLEWDEQSGQFRQLKPEGSNAIEITENTKLTVVGHGGRREGKVTVAGKTADQLAEVIAKLMEPSSPLHWSSNQGSVKKIGIVSCNIGAGEEGEGFLEKFFQEMESRSITVGSVAARMVEVIVGEDGRKVTRDSDNPEIEYRYNPTHRIEHTLDKDNNLREVSKTKRRSPEWQKNPDLDVENDPLVRKNIPNHNLNYKEKNGIYRISDDHLAQFIKDSITQRFGSEVDSGDLNTESLTVYTGSGSTETVEVSTVNGLEGLLNNIKDIIQTSNSKRKELLQKHREQLQKNGVQIDNNIKLKDTWFKITEKAYANKNFRENFFEKIENEMANYKKYFHFKNYIYSINMNDFYVNLHGTTDQNHISEVSEHIRDVENREKTRGHVAYDEMDKMINKGNFVEMTKLWVSGRQDRIGKINPYDGMAVIATHISEPVRNPDTFIINCQLWDLHQSWGQFRDHNPMARGRTWSGNHAAIGLDYETSDQNMQEQIKDETLSIMKKWTIFRSDQFFRSDSEPSNFEPMTLDLVKTKMEEVIQPLFNTNFERQRRLMPLSEEERNDLLNIEKQGRENSLETKLHLKMMEDRKQLVEKITDIIREQTPEDRARYQEIKSVERYEGGIKIVLPNKQNPLETKVILIPVMKDTLKSEDVLNSYFGESHSVANKINHGLAIYGTLMNVQAVNQMFAEGRKWEGGVMLAQGAQGVSELINDFVGDIAQKSIAKFFREKTAATEISSMSEIGNVAKEIPVLLVAFTIFNIYEDLKQDSPIGIGDAMLQETIFVSSLAGPEMLPVTVALTITQLVIDPLYHEIRHELDGLSPNASGLDKFVAVIKGVGLAIKDVAFDFLDVLKQITTPGMLYNVNSLEEEHRKSMDTVHKLKTAENYFKILDEKDGGVCHRKIDFTQGEESAYGGNLTVKLTDHRSMIISWTDPVTLKTIEKVIHFEKDCEAEDLVLGIGDAVNIKMQQKTATTYWFIPLQTEEVISSMAVDDKSLYGTYIGNAKPNRFFAVQQNIINGLSYTLDKYHYELYGRDGNDIFFLGPQMSFVHGGNGQDIYYIPLEGGKTEIYNQANDKLMDLLVFNITFQRINARKIGNDLKLFYNNLHEIWIKKWFLGEEYQHMNFKSSDGILFDVGPVQFSGKVELHPVTIDLSGQDSVRNITLQDSPWKTVLTVIGTDFDDIISGNQLNNVIQGQGGANTIAGREGKDMYILQEKESCDTIDNFANDDLMDIVELPVELRSLNVTITPPFSLKIQDSNGKSCVIIKDWKRGWQWQHIIFKTKDFAMFQVSNTTAEPKISRLVLDYSDSKEGVNINLNSIPGNENIMTVIGSSYHDSIQGNNKANFIQKGRGGGNLSGGNGSDTYIIDCGPDPIFINNYADDGLMDVLYIKENFDNLSFEKQILSFPLGFSTSIPFDLYIGSCGKCQIIILEWFTSEKHRHLQIRTEDGVIFSIPSGTKPVIYAIDYSRGYAIKEFSPNFAEVLETTFFGLNVAEVTKIIGPPRYIHIYGNEKDNYIDPGKNGALMTGANGSDTYQIRKYYEGSYTINNYATDHKMDYLVLDVNFRDIHYTIETFSFAAFNEMVLTAPSVAKWQCRINQFGVSEEHRHLVVKTNDVWFTFSETLEMQLLFSDYRLHNKELHLDLSAGILHSLPTVYGSLQERNFIDGNALNNAIIGGKNTDVLCGKDGNDVLQGLGGKDYLSGGPGDDQIHGGEGDDLILGEAGNDLIYPGPGADTVYGGTGSDTLLFLGNISSESGVFVSLHHGFGLGADAEGDLYFGIENILGSSYDDILIGNDDNNYLNGAGGNDLIQPMGGYDVLHGGEGKDVYNLIDATGTKMINNFAMDGKEDLIYIDNSDKFEISQSQSNDDLMTSFYYRSEPDANLTILIKNWYISEKNKHINFYSPSKEEVNSCSSGNFG